MNLWKLSFVIIFLMLTAFIWVNLLDVWGILANSLTGVVLGFFTTDWVFDKKKSW